MADVWPAIPAQRAVCIDDGGKRITLRQIDEDGREHCLEVARPNLRALITALEAVEAVGDGS